MDGPDTEVGSKAFVDAVTDIPTTVMEVSPMRRLFVEKRGVDRRLLVGFVSAFAKTKGLEHEDAHRILSAIAEKIGFECPGVTMENRTDRISDDDKGESYTTYAHPHLDAEALARSMRGEGF